MHFLRITSISITLYLSKVIHTLPTTIKETLFHNRIKSPHFTPNRPNPRWSMLQLYQLNNSSPFYIQRRIAGPHPFPSCDTSSLLVFCLLLALDGIRPASTSSS
uniref:Putative ovule protein n=1 Tax=Solanum chacoense TaxID=4108 RepID=A0A0V0HE29_SOLCH